MANDDQHPEFFNYAQHIEEQRLYDAHEQWKHTTFFGKLTTSVLAYAQNSQFFGAIADGLTNQNTGNGYSPYARTLSICLVMSIVIVGIVGIYAIGNIIQTIIGKEIVIEQEIIIEETVKLSDLMKENGDNDGGGGGGSGDGNGDGDEQNDAGDESVRRRNKKMKRKVQ